MVTIAATRSDTEQDVSVYCSDCFWSEDVAQAQALDVATQHETSSDHLRVELANEWFEQLVERLRVERGY